MLRSADPGEGPSDEGSTVNADRRRERKVAKKLLRVASSIENVRKCGAVTHGESVGIARRGERAHFTGLVTCGSVWACPVCSARIWAQRSDEVREAIDAHHATGGRVVMVTLTMRHNRRDPLNVLWDAGADAWRAARGGNRAVRRAMEKAGKTGWIRVVEVTHGANGWHLHVHALVFVQAGATQDTADDLGAEMFGAWARRLAHKGFRPVRDRGGLNVQLVGREDADGGLGDYLTKAVYSESSTAAEMTGQHNKRARGENVTPWGILGRMVRLGTAQDHAIWREWEQASKGRRALTWSVGLRDRLLTDEERTDEEIAAEHDDDRIVVALLPLTTWRAMMLVPHGEAQLLEVAEAVPINFSRQAIDGLLAAHGLPPSLAPPEPCGPLRE